MERHFKLYRDVFTTNATFGKIYDPEGNFICYTLEDVARPYGIKVYGETCIPATIYDVDSYYLRVDNFSKNRKAAVIFTEHNGDGLYHLKSGGIEFTQVLAHGGNRIKDTLACLLVNKERDTDNETAWGSMKTEFAEKVEEYLNKGFDTRLKVYNHDIK